MLYGLISYIHSSQNSESQDIIHAKKPVECVNCHGDKLSVSVPNCTKCHDGPIHKVHAGKVSTKTCEYFHKNITNMEKCTKCHKSPPEIVKPLKTEGMVMVCQNCHPKTSVATIHGAINDKKGCYGCHKGTSKSNGSEIPHIIHATKVDCKGCHEENKNVVVPQCTKCHHIDKLHAFNKIGKLTAQSGLKCSICHPGESKGSEPQTAPPKSEKTSNQTKAAPVETANIQPSAVASI